MFALAASILTTTALGSSAVADDATDNAAPETSATPAQAPQQSSENTPTSAGATPAPATAAGQTEGQSGAKPDGQSGAGDAAQSGEEPKSPIRSRRALAGDDDTGRGNDHWYYDSEGILHARQSNLPFGSQCSAAGSGDLYILGGAGQIQRIRNGKIIATYDIPDHSYLWTKFLDFSGSTVTKSWTRQVSANTKGDGGSFNGLGVAGHYVYVMESDNNTNDAANSVNLIHALDTETGQWYQLTNHGVLQNNEASFTDAQGNTVDPANSPAVDSRTNFQSSLYGEDNTTFTGANVAWRMGVGRSDGVYIFGGYTGGAAGGNTYAELYALIPNGNGPQGRIVQLGAVDLGRAYGTDDDSSYNGDIQLDRDGNLLLMVADPKGNAAYSTTEPDMDISVFKIDAHALNQALQSPVRTWTGSAWQNGTGTGNLGALPIFTEVHLPGVTSRTSGTFDAFSFAPDGSLLLAKSAAMVDAGGLGNDSTTSVIYQVNPATGQVEDPGTGLTSNQNSFTTAQPVIWDTKKYGDARFGITDTKDKTLGPLIDGGAEITEIVDMDGCPSNVPPELVVTKDVVTTVNEDDAFAVSTAVQWENAGNGARAEKTVSQSDTVANGLLIAPGVDIDITETPGSQNTDLTLYDSTLTCTYSNGNASTAIPEDSISKKQQGTGWVVTVPTDSMGDVNCHLTNTAKDQPEETGSLTFEKIGTASDGSYDADDPRFLAGSEWTLEQTASTSGADGSDDAQLIEQRITDCVAASDQECTQQAGDGQLFDSNHEAGKFTIAGLPLGTYSLTEAKQPEGFQLDQTSHNFTISADSPSASFTGAQAIKNKQSEVPPLPFSGGLGRDAFLIAGGAALLLGTGVAIAEGRKRRQKQIAFITSHTEKENPHE